MITNLLDDILAKVKGQRSFLEKVMGYVPLYHGYKEKELRRESDGILREHIFRILEQAKSDLKKTQTYFIQKNNLDKGKKLERVLTKCDTIAQRVHHAVGGYSGFWDAIKIREKELDRLYEMDSTLASLAENIRSSAKQLYESSKNNGAVDQILDNFSSNIDLFEKQMITRNEVISGYG